MDIETILFIMFGAFFVFGSLVTIIGLIVERMLREELDFDDVEGIKKVLKKEGK